MKKARYWLVATILLPLCYGLTIAFWQGIRPFKNVPEESFYFLLGVFSYFAFQWTFFRPMRTYVFGHELTHALAAWMVGAKVKRFKVSKHGGSVSVSKSNVFISLAPYMFPTYALMLLSVYAVINHFWFPLNAWWRWFLWMLGGSLGFHIALTVYALRQGQPDLKHGGKFLSGVLIYIANAVVLVFMLSILFPRTVPWDHVVKVGGRETWGAVEKLAAGSDLIWQQVKTAVSP